MLIAFYAPMKRPDDPVPSGDRTMARLLMAAMNLAGHEVKLASSFRSWDSGDAQRQSRLAAIGDRLANRMLRRQRSADERPSVWFTYHLYHKAPDHLGPRVSAGLRIPYVVAEASSAAKRANGRWASGWAAAAAAIARADLILGLNPADDDGLRPLLASPGRLRRLLPFVDARPFAAAAAKRDRHRRSLVERLQVDAAEPLLLSVAMMRAGHKLASFKALSEALAQLMDRRWRLLIVGDGPAAPEVDAACASLRGRVIRLGCLSEEELRGVYTAADLCLWPAIGEAWGMTLLEAQASGLPVVAGDSGGVGAIVQHGTSGLLVPGGQVAAFAEAVRVLLDHPERRELMREAARRHIGHHHDLPKAALALDESLRALRAPSERAS